MHCILYIHSLKLLIFISILYIVNNRIFVIVYNMLEKTHISCYNLTFTTDVENSNLCTLFEIGTGKT